MVNGPFYWMALGFGGLLSSRVKARLNPREFS